MYLIFGSKQSLQQYQIADTISKTPDAKVLIYDTIDNGYYTLAGILPANRYFCFLNIEDKYPNIKEEQNRLIEEGYFDYIITTHAFEEEWDNYEFIMEGTGTYVNYNRKSFYEGYKLYKRVQE